MFSSLRMNPAHHPSYLFSPQDVSFFPFSFRSPGCTKQASATNCVSDRCQDPSLHSPCTAAPWQRAAGRGEEANSAAGDVSAERAAKGGRPPGARSRSSPRPSGERCKQSRERHRRGAAPLPLLSSAERSAARRSLRVQRQRLRKKNAFLPSTQTKGKHSGEEPERRDGAPLSRGLRPVPLSPAHLRFPPRPVSGRRSRTAQTRGGGGKGGQRSPNLYRRQLARGPSRLRENNLFPPPLPGPTPTRLRANGQWEPQSRTRGGGEGW